MQPIVNCWLFVSGLAVLRHIDGIVLEEKCMQRRRGGEWSKGIRERSLIPLLGADFYVCSEIHSNVCTCFWYTNGKHDQCKYRMY